MSDPHDPYSSQYGSELKDVPRHDPRSPLLLVFIIAWLILIVGIVAAQFIAH